MSVIFAVQGLCLRGVLCDMKTQKILSLADQQQGFSRSPDAVYDPPPPVMRVWS